MSDWPSSWWNLLLQDGTEAFLCVVSFFRVRVDGQGVDVNLPLGAQRGGELFLQVGFVVFEVIPN
jgi:hypothetical protein